MQCILSNRSLLLGENRLRLYRPSGFRAANHGRADAADDADGDAENEGGPVPAEGGGDRSECGRADQDAEVLQTGENRHGESEL